MAKSAYLSVDFEGVAGAVSSKSVSRTGPDYQAARRRLTLDVNEAAKAFFGSGFDRVAVCDGHADMENLLIDELDPRIQLISGAMRPSLQMQGIEDGFDCFVSFGHAGAGLSARGVLNHTYNGGKIYNLRLNGIAMNETVANSVCAGHYGVPLIAVIGDDVLIEEVQAHMPHVAGIETKKGITRYSAISHSPEQVRKAIYSGILHAVANLDKAAPFTLPEPLTLEIDYMDTGMADTACLVPGVRRAAPRTVAFTGDAQTVFKLQELLIFRLIDRLP